MNNIKEQKEFLPSPTTVGRISRNKQKFTNYQIEDLGTQKPKYCNTVEEQIVSLNQSEHQIQQQQEEEENHHVTVTIHSKKGQSKKVQKQHDTSIQDFNCPLLMKRKAGNSSEISAFDKVQKKPKLAYQDDSSFYLSNDGILKVNPTYLNTRQSYNPMENPQFITNNIALPSTKLGQNSNFSCEQFKQRQCSCSGSTYPEDEKEAGSKVLTKVQQQQQQLQNVNNNSSNRKRMTLPPMFGMNLSYFNSVNEPDNNNGKVIQMLQEQSYFFKGMHKDLEQSLITLYTMMLKSNQMLRDVKDKQSQMQDQVKSLRKENQELKQFIFAVQPKKFRKIFEDQKQKETKNSIMPKQQVGKSFLSTSDQLLEALYTKQQIEQFSYSLVSEKEIDLPIYRQRNFGFRLKLVDSENKIVRNSNYMAVNVSLYTTSNPPRRLQMNTAGNNILKQTTDSQLQLGQCLLDKFQIREVTSHYPNGWLFLIVTVKNDTPSGKAFSRHQKCATTTQVNPELIKPFIISKLIVKAKKMK